MVTKNITITIYIFRAQYEDIMPLYARQIYHVKYCVRYIFNIPFKYMKKLEEEK